LLIYEATAKFMEESEHLVKQLAGLGTTMVGKRVQKGLAVFCFLVSTNLSI